MTSVDDSLFEPISGPATSPGKPTSGGIIASGIMKRPDATAIEIIIANPKQIYMDAARDVMNYAVACHPQMFDVRKPTQYPPNLKIPLGAVRLDDLVRRFHDGDKVFWVSCPKLISPRAFEFAGRFGHFKLLGLTPKPPYVTTIPFVLDWFWLDTTEGQVSAIEIGLLVVHPDMVEHYAFLNQQDAQKYYTT